MNLQFLSKFFPSQPEAKVDQGISDEMKLVAGVLAGSLSAHLTHHPGIQHLLNVFNISPDVFPALCGLGAAYATAWLCAFVHIHFYNGSADK